jgi:hypothetical protein
MPLDDVCFGIKRLVLGVCLPQSENSDIGVADAKWDAYYRSLKDDLLLIDIEIRNALHIKLDSYYARYNAPDSQGLPEPASYHLVWRDDAANGDMMHCLSQFAGKLLLNKEASRLLVAVTNAKVIFLTAFHEILQVKTLDFLAERDMPDARFVRQRRFIWTDPIAALTGLASQSSVDVFNENAKNLLLKEEDDAKEIQKLENKTNEMLGTIQSQNQRVMKLYQLQNQAGK